MEYTTHTLANGLRMVHLPSESPVAYCGFAVNAGARDEQPSEYGLAHFVEHMIFKGNFLFIVITKYWLIFLCCTIHP